MALIVVGGQTKHVGKTTLVCEIIRHFVSAQWTAAKITSHIHEADGCRPIASGTGWSICEQRESDSNADTLRYLSAGAERSLLVCAELQSLLPACSAFKKEISMTANVIVESTAAVRLLVPDLFLLFVEPACEDVKASAAEQLSLADALVMSAESDKTRAVRYSEDVPTFHSFEGRLDPSLAKMIEKLWRK